MSTPSEKRRDLIVRRIYPAAPCGVVAMTADGAVHIDLLARTVALCEPRWEIAPCGQVYACLDADEDENDQSNGL